MKQHFTLAIAALALIGTASCNAQSGGYKRLPSGLEYKIDKKGKGTMKPSVGDYIEFNIVTSVHFPKGDSILFDSRKLNNNQPVPAQITPPQSKGDLMEGFMLLSEGDSAHFQYPVDSLPDAGNQLPPWLKKGQNLKLVWTVAVTKVKNRAAVEQEQKAAAEKQVSIDDQALNEYFSKNGIKPMKTASGLYYTVKQAGNGPKPVQGDSVSMNYTGMLLNGTKFDSNTEPSFGHVDPFWFMLGRGMVIPGWDEGIALFPKGSKGTLYIPSRQAYGQQGRPPQIPASSPLIFDVEVVDVKHHGGK